MTRVFVPDELLVCHCPVCSSNRAAAMEEAEGARDKSAATRERDAISTKTWIVCMLQHTATHCNTPDCMYGVCGPCCAAVVRNPGCNVAKHSKNNKHN